MPLPSGPAVKRAGICTIGDAAGDWMVCPNRLFALDAINPTDLREWSSLSNTVRYVLESLGATPDRAGYPIGAWSEITVEEARNGKTFDYRFDFILNTVDETEVEEFAADWGVELANARRCFGRSRTLYAPKRVEGFPLIVEIMTASTSGSSQSKKVGIGPAFMSAWETAFNGAPVSHDAPGLNVRQVWGRMVSQLIAKSEAGEYWGGRTVWLMQDLLLNYIHATTHISASRDASQVPLPLPLRGANIVSFKFGVPTDPGQTRSIVLDRFIGDDIPNMFDALGEATMHGILHAPFVPEPGVLALKLLSAAQQRPSKLEVIILP